MTLLDQDQAVVYPEESYTDSRGNASKRPSTTGVPVRCRIYPNSSSRKVSGTEAQTIAAGYTFQSHDAPLGSWSRVEWRGRSLTVANGPAEVGPIGSTTRHISAVLIETR